MRFQVLGPLTASVPLPSAAQPRRLLSVLLARPNEFVKRDTLVDELWPDGAPSSAAAIVQVTVSKLRKTLSPGVGAGSTGQRLRCGPRGYALTVEPGELDADDFLTLSTSGVDDRRQRRRSLEAALAHWRGAAFADVAGGPLVEAHKLWLEDRRRSALLQLVELELADGDARAVVERLEPVLAVRPADERLAAGLASALGALGRRDGALDVLRRTRRALWDEAGVWPSADLLTVYRRITGTEWTTPGPPAQLPPATPDFTGRATELAEIGRLLKTAAPVVVHGPAGAGKSALAVQAAWRARRRFPDGQLVANLRGPGGLPAEPRDVLAAFLRQLGATPGELGDGAGLLAQWRGYTADRRLLVLLEDAASERQVRALLPSGPGCATLVTARRGLPGLTAARAVPVPALSTEDAHGLLAAVAGEVRTEADPVATQELLRHCDGLALAVRIAGIRLASRPNLRVAELAARLADDRRRLDELVAGDLGVRSVVTSALRERPAAERYLLRLLAGFGEPVPDWCAAALLGKPLAEVAGKLDVLVDGHLLAAAGTRYVVPGFVRLVLGEQPPPETDSEALRRALEVTLALAEHARGVPAPAGTDPEALRRVTACPEAWARAETGHIAASVRLADTHGWHDLTERLADVCTELAGTPWLGHAAREVSVIGLAAARRRRDPVREAAKLYSLGSVHSQHGRWRQARNYFVMAEARYRALEDPRGMGSALVALADVHLDAGDPLVAEARLREALDVLRQCGDRRGQAVAAAQFGSLAEDLGDVRRAVESFEASMLLARDGDDSRGHDQAAKRYADVLRRQGRTDQAADLLTAALGGAVRMGERHWEAHVLRSLGDLHTEAGEVPEGEHFLSRSLELFDQIGHRHAAAYTHRSLAETRRLAGDLLGAQRHLRAAMGVFRDLRDRRGAGYVLLSLGRLHAGSDATREAVRVLRKSADLFRDLGFPLWELRALHDLTAVTSESPERDRTREVLTKIRI